MSQAAHQLELGADRRIEHALGWHYPDLRAFELRLVIDFPKFTVTRTSGKRKGTTFTIGPVFSWKRSRTVTMINGHGSIGLTTEAKHWAKAAAAQLRRQWESVFREPLPKHVELNAAIVSYLPERRLIDASNLYQGPEDVLQVHQPKCKPRCKLHASILEDDSAIRTHCGSDRLLDRRHPRVEITLTPYNPAARAPAHQLPPDIEF